ncbi:MAG: hypothetical protein A2096_02130 [Spirochaetes bacterium GWF1_41_5]|nr:MAG: hypothetical protein A2096_02130 [Spirochaetes bacterium GWF1_41_5]HBE03749.1 hypothetical protein [Spirochaetia bacterium]
MEKINSRILIVLKYIITIFAFILLYTRVDIRKAYILLKESRPEFFLGSLSLTPVFYFFKIFKWKRLIEKYCAVSPLPQVIRSYMYGLFYGYITPGRLGELMRVRSLNGERSKLFSLVLYDRFLDLFAVAFLTLFFFGLWLDKNYYFIAALFIMICFFYLKNIIILIKRINFSRMRSLKEKINMLLEPVCGIKITDSLSFILITLIPSIAVLFQFYFIINGFKPVPVSIIFPVPAIQLSNLIPVTIGNMGLREWISIFFLEKYGISGEIAANTSFCWFMISALPAVFYVACSELLRVFKKLRQLIQGVIMSRYSA